MKFTMSGRPNTVAELKKFIANAEEVGAENATKVSIGYGELHIHIGETRPARKAPAKKAVSS